VEDGEVKVERYWDYPLPAPAEPRSLGELAEELREILREAVRLRLMSDVPLGAMLSGGLDSSVVVALMAESSSTPVKTFTVAFREDGDANELESAARVARRFGCDHESVELSFAETTLDLDDLVWYLDEPVAELSALGFHVLSRLAAQHVTVALSGQGADELFGGYRKHAAARIIDVAPKADWIARQVSHLPLGAGDLRRFVGAAAAPSASERLMSMSGVTDGRQRAVYGERLAHVRRVGAREAIDERASRLAADVSALASTLFLDAQLALVDNMLHYFDRMSMAHSLEVRVPFLDHVLVEWAAQVPDAMKVGLHGQKLVLREAARGLIPEDIIDRKKVAFFRRSAGRFLAGQIGAGAAERMLEGPIVAEGLVRREALATLLAEFRSGHRDHAQDLLGMLVLDIWLERFAGPVDSFTATPATTTV
jgi:asparagine synthase (glutamine-hydrolysing)